MDERQFDDWVSGWLTDRILVGKKYREAVTWNLPTNVEWTHTPARLKISQFSSRKVCRSTFLDYMTFVDRWIPRLNVEKRLVRQLRVQILELTEFEWIDVTVLWIFWSYLFSPTNHFAVNCVLKIGKSTTDSEALNSAIFGSGQSSTLLIARRTVSHFLSVGFLISNSFQLVPTKCFTFLWPEQVVNRSLRESKNVYWSFRESNTTKKQLFFG